MLETNDRRIILSGFVKPTEEIQQTASTPNLGKRKFDPFLPLRQWVDSIEIDNPEAAKFVAKVIPAQCPFERDVVLFGRKVGHIPPLCKLNPLYDQFVGLRFRALCYLVDKCGEDISAYC